MSTYSYNDVKTAVNAAADLAIGEGLDADTTSLIDFVVNATLTMLTEKDAGIEDILEENWTDEEARDIIRDIITGA